MPQSPLLVKAAAGRQICDITPESAGWTHVGFRALRLEAGESESLETGARELCLVVLTGTVDVQVGGATHAGLGSRASVFEEKSPDALYVLVTNPCDVLTVVAQKVSGLPTSRVFST